nr:hypothetical protein [Bradyrhizobium brasilense]
MPAHQAFDPAAAGATSLRPQRGMDPRAAMASAAVLMNLSDRSQAGETSSPAHISRTG